MKCLNHIAVFENEEYDHKMGDIFQSFKDDHGLYHYCNPYEVPPGEEAKSYFYFALCEMCAFDIKNASDVTKKVIRSMKLGSLKNLCISYINKQNIDTENMPPIVMQKNQLGKQIRKSNPLDQKKRSK